MPANDPSAANPPHASQSEAPRSAGAATSPAERAEPTIVSPHRDARGFSVAQLLFLDWLVILAAFLVTTLWLAAGGTSYAVDRRFLAMGIFEAIALPAGLAAVGQYRLEGGRLPRWSRNRVALVVVATGIAGWSLAWILGVSLLVPEAMLGNLVLAGVGIGGWRWALARRETRRRRKGVGLANVLLVGTGPLALEVAAEMVRRPEVHGRRVVGFLARPGEDAILEGGAPRLEGVPADLRRNPGVWIPAGDGEPPAGDPFELALDQAIVENAVRDPRHLLAVVGRAEVAGLRDVIAGLSVDEILVTGDGVDVAAISRLAWEHGADVLLLPEHHPELTAAYEPGTLGPYTVLGLYRRPISRLGTMAKRALDVVGGVALLVLTSPILLLAALAIKLEDPQLPVFYRGAYVGRKGRHFRMWKLTTMVADADERREELEEKNTREGPWFQVDPADDPRITRVGRFLRRYTLNEIPQFINVVAGDMSLVGPRPLKPDEVSRFVDHDLRYFRIFQVKPGMTSPWALRDRSTPSFERRVELDFAYIERWSFWRDVSIILRTPGAILRDKGR